MNLEKWYLDVLSGEHLEVFYRARLTYGPLRIACQASMDESGSRQSKFQLGTSDALPDIVTENTIAAVKLKTEREPLAWTGVVRRPIELWSDGNHRVTWEPMVINGKVVGVGAGLGYAEKLDMNIAPWRLGIRRLWWGHFCGARHSLVWIKWEGRYPLQLSLIDGTQSTLDEVAVDRICAGSTIDLQLAESRLVIDTTIGSGALAQMPLLKHLAPGSFLKGREQKWTSHAVLCRSGAQIDSGRTIHEVVTWQ